MRTKILFSVALALGIASLVLLILNAADQATITALILIGLTCISIEFILGRKDKDSDEQE